METRDRTRTQPPARHEPHEIATFAVLLGLTGATMTFAGGSHMISYAVATTGAEAVRTAFREGNDLALISGAAQFTGCMLAILGAHEYGHYRTASRYGLRTSLPLFLPAPTALGTIGAFIRVEGNRGRHTTCDVAMAGPIAGFAMTLPVLWYGLEVSTTAPTDAVREAGHVFGLPILMTAVGWLTHGPIPAGETLVLHPVGVAAWAGLLLTSLNLIPAGFLDGGHIVRALAGTRTLRTTGYAMTALFALLSLNHPVWLVWTALMVLTTTVGGKYPPVADPGAPIGRARTAWLATLPAMAVLSFTADAVRLRRPHRRNGRRSMAQRTTPARPAEKSLKLAEENEARARTVYDRNPTDIARRRWQRTMDALQTARERAGQTASSGQAHADPARARGRGSSSKSSSET